MKMTLNELMNEIRETERKANSKLAYISKNTYYSYLDDKHRDFVLPERVADKDLVEYWEYIERVARLKSLLHLANCTEKCKNGFTISENILYEKAASRQLLTIERYFSDSKEISYKAVGGGLIETTERNYNYSERQKDIEVLQQNIFEVNEAIRDGNSTITVEVE